METTISLEQFAREIAVQIILMRKIMEHYFRNQEKDQDN